MSMKPSGESTADARSSQLLAELEVDQMGKFPVGRIATVGRAPESNVILNTRSVSRHHARIFYEGNHFWIKDLGSANGTRVNGKKITLQMLSDGDKLCFGEVKSVFRTSAKSSGPAPLAKDPLADLDKLFADGTPTGGLGAPLRAPCEEPKAVQPDGIPGPPDTSRAAEVSEREDELRRRVEALETENAMLREQLRQTREGTGATSMTPPASTQSRALDDPQAENVRLKRLITQLERALADANVRIRNLQERVK